MKTPLHLLALLFCAFTALACAEDKPATPPASPAPAMTAEETAAFAQLAQEQRVAASDLKAAQAELDRQQERTARLNEIGIRLYTQACADRGIMARDFAALREACKVADGQV